MFSFLTLFEISHPKNADILASPFVVLQFIAFSYLISSLLYELYNKLTKKTERWNFGYENYGFLFVFFIGLYFDYEDKKVIENKEYVGNVRIVKENFGGISWKEDDREFWIYRKFEDAQSADYQIKIRIEKRKDGTRYLYLG